MQIIETTPQGSQHQIFEVVGSPIEYLLFIEALLNTMGARLQAGATVSTLIDSVVFIPSAAASRP